MAGCGLPLRVLGGRVTYLMKLAIRGWEKVQARWDVIDNRKQKIDMNALAGTVKAESVNLPSQKCYLYSSFSIIVLL